MGEPNVDTTGHIVVVHASSKALWKYLRQNKLLYDADVACILRQACIESMSGLGCNLAYLTMKEAVFLMPQKAHETNNDYQYVSAVSSVFSTVVNQSLKINSNGRPLIIYSDLLKLPNPKSVVQYINATTRNAEKASEAQLKEKLGSKYSDVAFESVPNIYTRGITIAYNYDISDYENYTSQLPKDVFQSYLNKFNYSVDKGWVKQIT